MVDQFEKCSGVYLAKWRREAASTFWLSVKGDLLSQRLARYFPASILTAGLSAECVAERINDAGYGIAGHRRQLGEAAGLLP